MTRADVEYARGLVAHDWLVTRAWDRLHFASLTGDQLADVADYACVEGPVRLACGRTAVFVSIPGFGARLSAPRCSGCCRALGYPQGKGSPKNDDECRRLLGLDQAS